MSHEKTTTPPAVWKTHAEASAIKPGAPTARTTDADVAPPPAISGLVPPSAAVGDPSFGLRVQGSGFNPASIIVFAGHPEPTTYFSPGELSTGMNMPLWLGADHLSVQVTNADGQASNTVTFDLQGPRDVPLDPAAASKPTPAMNQI